MARSTIYKSEPTNLAIQKLRALPGTLEQIAETIGSKPNTVHEWRQGSKQPSRRSRELVSKAFPEIDPDDWERDASQPTAAEQLDEVELDPAEVSNLDAINRLIREIRLAAKDPDITGSTRERLAAREIVALKFREELLNRDALLKDKIIASHSDWPIVRDALAAALAPFPDAAYAVADALESLGV